MPAVRARQLTTRTLISKTGLSYRIFVSAPEGAPPPAGFAVIYLVDGNAWTGLAAEITRLNEHTIGPTIVVGIGYPTAAFLDGPRRTYDLTPPGALKAPIAEAAGLKTGGADEFLSFIDEAVKPAIDREFKIDPARQVLFGHSLGGLFAVHALFTHPEAFSAFIIASPALWWNDRQVLRDEAAFTAWLAGHQGPRVLITAGEYEAALNPAQEADLRRLAAAHPELLGGKTVDQALDAYRAEMKADHMVDYARDLAGRLAGHGETAQFVLFPGEDHNSEAPDAINRGVPFALRPAS
jgi:hypothetical protein